MRSETRLIDECSRVIVHGRVYDVSDFLDDHPGGKSVVLRWAGKDATETYEPIHPPDTLDKYLDKSKHLGEVDMGSVAQEKEYDPEEEERQERVKRMPILEQVGFPPMNCRFAVMSQPLDIFKKIFPAFAAGF